MSCFRNQEYIKTTEQEWLRIMPLGKGKTIQNLIQKEKYPVGIVTIGKFFYKKRKRWYLLLS
jgi:hypothetical protein